MKEFQKSLRQIEWEIYRDTVLANASVNSKPDYLLSLSELEEKHNLKPIREENMALGKVRETGQPVMFIMSPQRGSEFIPELQLKAKETELKKIHDKYIPVVVVTEEVGDFKDVNARGYALSAGYLAQVYSEKTQNPNVFTWAKRDLRFYGIPARYLKEGSLEVTKDGENYQKGSLLRFFVESALHTKETWDIVNDPGSLIPMRLEGSLLGQLLRQDNLQKQLEEIAERSFANQKNLIYSPVSS